METGLAIRRMNGRWVSSPGLGRPNAGVMALPASTHPGGRTLNFPAPGSGLGISGHQLAHPPVCPPTSLPPNPVCRLISAIQTRDCFQWTKHSFTLFCVLLYSSILSICPCQGSRDKHRTIIALWDATKDGVRSIHPDTEHVRAKRQKGKRGWGWGEEILSFTWSVSALGTSIDSVVTRVSVDKSYLPTPLPRLARQKRRGLSN